MSRKISQINFSFIQHLNVGDDLYITDYEQISSACHEFQREELSAEGSDVLQPRLDNDIYMHTVHTWQFYKYTKRVFMICFPQNATDFFLNPILIYRYIPPKRKKENQKTHSPLTTLKIQKVETPCCWEMRIEKEERKNEKVPVSPQNVFKQMCRVEKPAPFKPHQSRSFSSVTTQSCHVV